MEKNTRYFTLLTKFSHANGILKFFGSFSEVKKLMLLLCHATKDTWDYNQNAFKFGLYEYKRKILRLRGAFNKEIASLFKSSEISKNYSLQGYVEDSYDVQRLSEFLDEVKDRAHFEQILVPHWFYSWDYHLLMEIFKSLERNNINETGVESKFGIDSVKDEFIPWIHSYQFDEKTKVDKIKKIGRLSISQSSITDGSFNRNTNDFSFPVEELLIKTDTLKMEELQFSDQILKSVKKITFRFDSNVSGDNKILIPTNLKLFESLEEIYYDNYGSGDAAEYFAESIESVKGMSPKFSIGLNKFSKIQEELVVEHTTFYFRDQDSIFEFRGDKLIFNFLPSTDWTTLIGRYFLLKKFEKISILGAKEIAFKKGISIEGLEIPDKSLGVLSNFTTCLTLSNSSDENIRLEELPKNGHFKISIDPESENFQKIVKLAEDIVNSGNFNKNRIEINLNGFSNKLFTENHNIDYLFRALSLPFTRLSYRSNDWNQKIDSDSTKAEICELLDKTKSGRTAEFITYKNLSKERKYTLNFVQSGDLRERDRKRLIEFAHSAVYHEDFNEDLLMPQDRFLIDPK